MTFERALEVEFLRPTRKWLGRGEQPGIHRGGPTGGDGPCPGGGLAR